MTMPLRTTRASLAALLCAAAFAAGCGGDDDGEAPAERPATVAAGEPLTIEATEYDFGPNAITVTSADGPTTQEITLDNRGSLPHDIEIRDGENVIARSDVIEGGDRDSLETHLAAGSYSFVCTVADHAEKGMRGTIAVR